MNTRSGKRQRKDAVEDSAVTLLVNAQRAARQEQRSAAAKEKRAKSGLNQVLQTARDSPPGSPLRQAVAESLTQFPELAIAKASHPTMQIGDPTATAHFLTEIRNNMQALQDTFKAEMAAFKAQQAQNLSVPELKDKTLKVVANAAVETMRRDPADSGEHDSSIAWSTA
jgi:hypothetical protein